MRTVLATGTGGLMFLLGLLFTLQGLDYVEGSEMSGETMWAVLGPIIAGFGVALLIVGLRRGGPSE